MIKFGSVCSGVEAASLAWEPLGWSAAWFAEIEKFPSAVLAHHWPDVVNVGDMCILPQLIRSGFVEAPPVLVGGTPCQAFSVAGQRRGLEDPRGQLTIKFVEVANAIDEQRPGDECIVVWENVPGAISSKDNAFGCFLGELVGEECPLEPAGKKWSNSGCVHGPQRTAAWRILEAQYFGVAQRRRRVFVVASARKGFNSAAVLFESEGVRRDTPPCRETGEGVAALTANGVGTCGADDNGHLIPTHQVSPCLQERGGKGPDSDCTQSLVISVSGQQSHSLTAEGFDSSGDGTGRGTPVIAFHHNAMPDQMNFSADTTASLTCSQQAAVMLELSVRRPMPVECERLQGMPDGHTAIPGAADGPRYKAIGNSKAVPVVRWLGRRLGAELCTP